MLYELIKQLERRRLIALFLVGIIGCIAIIFSWYVHIKPLQYFGGDYNNMIIYGLFFYKLIELLVLYYLLMYRHILFLLNKGFDTTEFPKIQKHTRLLYFLIPQGNTVFGMIAYKLSGEVKFFLFFSFIAVVALFIIKPNRLNVTHQMAKIR